MLRRFALLSCPCVLLSPLALCLRSYKYTASGSLGAAQLAGVSLAVDVVGNKLTVTAVSGGAAPQAGVVIDQFNITKQGLQTLTFSVTLGRYTVATFTAAARGAFTAGIAALLGVGASAVTITSVVDLPSPTSAGRHLLQSGGGISVSFNVITSQSLVNLAPIMFNAAAVAAALSAYFSAAGLVSPTVTATGVGAYLGPAPMEEYNNKKDLGALAILVVLPIGAFIAFWFSPLRQRCFKRSDVAGSHDKLAADTLNRPSTSEDAPEAPAAAV